MLDVGCADGALFRRASGIRSGVGIDVRTVDVDGLRRDTFELRPGSFPDAVASSETFDAIVMLAIVEHVPEGELRRWAAAIPPMLRAKGRLVITTPSPLVDRILNAGMTLRVLDGMDVHQHHRFDPNQVPAIFSVPGLRLKRQERFELGLNHLFVFDGEDA